MAVKIQLRRGTQTEFNSANPTLLDGEVALVTDDKKIIIGPGAYNDLNAAGKFINFHTDQGLGTVGGANGTSEIPIKLVGASGQAVAALQVLKNGGSNGILEVFTDNTTELVKINGADGAVDDISLLLKAKASQTAAVVEVQSSDQTTPRFQVKEEGQTLIQPNDTTDVSLDVRGSSGSQSSGIMRVRQGSNDVLVVKSDGVESEQTVTVDGASIIAQVEDTAASNVTITASATDSDKVVTVDGNSGTENLSITAGGAIATNGAVTSEGKGTFADAEIDVTGRSLGVASVMRRDEILADLQAFKLYEYNVTGTGAAQKIQKLSTTDGTPVSVVNPSNLLSTAVVTSSGSESDTDPDMKDTPSSSVFPAIKLVSGESLLLKVNQTATATSPSNATSRVQINSYTSDSLASGVKTTIRDETNTSSGSAPLSVVHAVTNTSGSDRFIAVASGGTGFNSGAASALVGQVFICKMVTTLLSTERGSSAFEITVLS
tara:strand:- start:684 stop:2153 length:1470 start_codon:yes stop_codon:yes gene_type:complete